LCATTADNCRIWPPSVDHTARTADNIAESDHF
jgi:hypothetical protein